MSESPEERALDALIDEVRREPTPDLDWERVERALAEPHARAAERRGVGSRAWMGGVALAAAAAIAFAVWPSQREEPPSPVSEATRAEPTPAFAVGATYDASGAPLTVSMGALGSITLAEGARARVRDTGRFTTLVLERGKVTAEVTPGLAPESFAVHAGRVRIATKGTVFSVDRGDVHANVAVRRGTVVVGSTGNPGATEGRQLSAPERASFPLDASAFAAVEAGPEASAEPVAPSTSPKPSTVPAAPPPERVTRAAAEIEAATKACFASHTKTAGGITVRADSLMKIRFDATGSVTALTFDPPLTPRVRACANAAAEKVQIPRSREGASFSRRVSL